MPKPRHFDLAGSTVLTLMVVSWSISPVIVRQFREEGVTVWEMNFWRYAVVFVSIWITVWRKYLRRGRPLHGQLTPEVWRKGLLPLVPMLICQISFPLAIYRLEPGLAGILHKQYIIWSVVMSMFLFAEERRLLFSGLFWVGMLCALSGSVGVIFFHPAKGWGGELWGIILIIIAAFTWAWYGVSIKQITRIIHPSLGCVVLVTYLFPALGVLFLASLVFGRPSTVFAGPKYIWVLILVSGYCNIYLPHIGFYWVIPRLGVTIPQTMFLLTAFLTAFFSWLIFSERLTPLQWASGVILIFGAIMTLTAQRHYLQERI